MAGDGQREPAISEDDDKVTCTAQFVSFFSQNALNCLKLGRPAIRQSEIQLRKILEASPVPFST